MANFERAADPGLSWIPSTGQPGQCTCSQCSHKLPGIMYITDSPKNSSSFLVDLYCPDQGLRLGLALLHSNTAGFEVWVGMSLTGRNDDDENLRSRQSEQHWVVSSGARVSESSMQQGASGFKFRSLTVKQENCMY
ncbi:hypothetical protein STEG23_004778 [Scotinomys teguina]